MSSFHFAQMADPQFGMFASVSRYGDEEVAERRARGLNIRKAERPISGFADETRLYTAAIEAANAIAPAFVVVCGDMVHDADNQAQVDELFRISAALDDGIPLYFVSGNHDVGEAPTADSLALYRERFGADNYSFDYQDCHFAVINSSLAYDPSNAPAEWRRAKQFLADDLSAGAAARRGAYHPVHASSAVREERERGRRRMVRPGRAARRAAGDSARLRRGGGVRGTHAPKRRRPRRRADDGHNERRRLSARRRPVRLQGGQGERGRHSARLLRAGGGGERGRARAR